MTPAVTVLLATRDGVRHLDAQLDSILDQAGVEVRVLVSDDGSTDGTLDLLARRTAVDGRVAVLPTLAPSGSAAANFVRLLRDADLAGADWVALSDQDDVWLPGKLARHAAILAAGGVEAVSSEVTAVSPDGSRRLVRKAFPQRAYDWVCEGPGPGSTFLLTPRLVALVRGVLASQPQTVARVDYHDWLLYALCRARGWGWHIDDLATVDYRQHDANVMGANHGLAAATGRLGLIRRRWHRGQAALLVELGRTVAPAPGELPAIAAELADTAGRRALLRRVPQLRRRLRDRVALAALVSTGIW